MGRCVYPKSYLILQAVYVLLLILRLQILVYRAPVNILSPFDFASSTCFIRAGYVQYGVMHYVKRKLKCKTSNMELIFHGIEFVKLSCLSIGILPIFNSLNLLFSVG